MKLGIIRSNDGDIAGGLIGKSPKQSFCFAERYPIAIIGENVEPHGYHTNVKMIEGSSIVFINGIGVCRAGDKASCNHIAGPGSSIIFSS